MTFFTKNVNIKYRYVKKEVKQVLNNLRMRNMKLLDKIKEIWNRLGQADVEVTSANAEEILKAEGNPELIVKETNKKTVVQKVATKPVKIGDILPTHNLEKEGR